MAKVSKVFCTNCGKQVDFSWKFCRYCGARQETDNQVFTYRDYVKIYCPRMIDKTCQGGVAGCPRDINKMAEKLCNNECSNEICTKCWNQPYNGEENNEH